MDDAEQGMAGNMHGVSSSMTHRSFMDFPPGPGIARFSAGDVV
jgi:hypothetical protein